MVASKALMLDYISVALMVALLVVDLAAQSEVMKAYEAVASWVVYLVFWMGISRDLIWVAARVDILVVKRAFGMAELMEF